MREDNQPPEALERHREYLRMLARVHLPARLQSKLDPSDVVQQTLLKAHENFEHYHGDGDAELAGWLRKILTNAMADALREFGAAKRNAGLERSLQAEVIESSARLEAILQADTSSPSARIIRHEDALRLAEALAKLSDEQRRAVELHHLQDWSVADIATEMNRSVASVAGLLRRGLKRLRELMKE